MFEFFKIVSKAFGNTVIVLMVILLGVILYLEANLPSVQSLREVHLQVPLKVFTTDGKLIAEFGEKRRIPVKLKEVPNLLINAILATEDRRFYEHKGVDLRGIIRAGFTLITKASKEQGGSTITMQVARNFFLSRKKTFIRKINEILLALKIEQELTKDEILELYLNVIYLGKRAYGVAAAAEVYYGIELKDLKLAQMAMIAGLPQAPSSINPLHAPEAAKKRRKHVLDRMLHYEFISNIQYQEAISAPLEAHYHGRPIEIEAAYVAELVRQELVQRFGEEVYGLGYEVYTTIESTLQKAANQAVRQGLLEYDQRHGFRKPILHYKLSNYKTAQEALQHWPEMLKNLPHYDDIKPAVVTSLEPTKAWILDANAQYREIPWKNMSWARPQLKSYTVGPSPQSPKDILQIGDVIYYMPLPDGTFKLIQIPEAEAALVALHPKDGATRALIGGFDYHLSHFNRVTQAERQPGSNFKPFIYTAALAEGFTLASVVNDSPLVYYDPVTGPWRPQNDKNKFYGPTRLRVSLARSQNLVAVRLLQAIGIPKMLEYAGLFGFSSTKLPPYLSLALGSGSATPMEIATGYCVLANGGFRITPYLIANIQDGKGKYIYTATPQYACPTCTEGNMQVAPRTISPQIAYLTTSALQDAIRVGTGQKALSIGRRDLSGKTGTTNDKLDAWYSGYNQDLVATAWVGFDVPRPLKEYGSQAALPIWIYFMQEALKNIPEKPLSQPPGIVSVRIDPATGLLARPNQKEAIFEYFAEGTAPTQMTHNPYDSTLGGQAEDADHIDSLF